MDSDEPPCTLARLTAAACAAMLCTMSSARAADYTLADLNDADILERSLFVCLWKTGHGAPDGEPSPVVCTTATISTDDAVHGPSNGGRIGRASTRTKR